MTVRILYGGGKDSLLTLHRLQDHKGHLHYFNLGHNAAAKEMKSLEYYANLYGWQYHIDTVPITLSDGMANPDRHKDDHVPFRNMLLLSLAINRYFSKEEDTVWYLGFPNYPDRYEMDGSPEYLWRMAQTVETLYPNVKVKTAIGRILPENVLDYLVRDKVDLSHLWFCDNNLDKMCGQCYKCHKTLEFLKSKHYYKNLKHLYHDL